MTFSTGLVFLISQLIHSYMYVLLAYVIMSWLVSFGVVNSRNGLVRFIAQVTDALVVPPLNGLKRVFPFLVVGGIDLSIIALYFILQVVELGLFTLVS